ncbi:MAG: tRNA (cytosine(32)/uridine(32)-2'-O)-methyltransferase TrmJ [Thiogranum sp.]|jgi:TrmH family RNA methyltransferase
MPPVRIVLVNTSHPGNIGAAARAMKNMGLTELSLVDPQLFPSAEATARASGADDLLAAASCAATLEQALEGCSLVIGASARNRTLPLPTLDPRECAALVEQQPADSRTAIVFGRERTGLTNDELDRCHYLVQIPTNPDYPSLNLAAAVQVVAYELRMAAGLSLSRPENKHRYATAEEMELFYRHLEETLIAIDFLDADNPRQLMRRLRRLFARARPNENEVNILRGVLTAIGQRRI